MSNQFLPVIGLFDGLRPEPDLTVSEWAAKFRILSSEESKAVGLWKNERTPYLIEPMDAMSANSRVKKITFMKGSQLGFTQAVINAVGYWMDVAPGPILYVMPSDRDVEDMSKVRLAKLIENTPQLAKRIATRRSRDGDNSTTFKAFPGGNITLVGAVSPSGFQSRSIRYVILDELDRMPPSVGGEGSPVSLAENRSQTFSNRKMILISTPKIEGTSQIAAEFAKTDQRKYHVPCPHCNHLHTLEIENLKWTWGKPVTAVMFCPKCGAGIEDRKKTVMLADGKWIATAPENANPDERGYHLNSLYSPYGMLSWPEVAKKIEGYQDSDGKVFSIEKRITFTNTIEGKTYKGEGEAPPWKDLYESRGSYPRGSVPDTVDFVTVGVDTQGDRLELEVVGWAPGCIAWSVDYIVIHGDPKDEETWEQLDAVLESGWENAAGRVFHSSMTCIDTGGNKTSFVYNYLLKKGPGRMRGIKGGPGTMMEKVGSPRIKEKSWHGKPIGKAKVWMLGVHIFKEELYSNLRKKPRKDGSFPPGYCHFPEDYNENYFQGLTSEKLVIKLNPKGFPVAEWTLPPHTRNEPLDCRVYASAAAAMLRMYSWPTDKWGERVRANCLNSGERQKTVSQEPEKVTPKPAQPPPKPEENPEKKPKKSGFWGGNDKIRW